MAEKLYYSMGEVAEMFDVNQSLIRHWESQFSVLRPKRNKKGNRLFTPQDVENLKRIYHLVKECGMTLEGAKRAMRRQPAGDAADRSGELLERLQRIRALLVEVREDLKAADGEIVAVGDDYGAESPAETPASAPVSAERPAAAGRLAPDTPPAVSADDAATPAAEASQAGIPDTETPARRRNRAASPAARRRSRSTRSCSPSTSSRCSEIPGRGPFPEGSGVRSRGAEKTDDIFFRIMKIRDITTVIETFAPLWWQESYDNAGLIVGRGEDEAHAALLAVDVTEEVLDEAERLGCDLVVTHHPIVFHALKRFNSADTVQRCVERAIRRGIALYACHTNLDSAPGGMSWHLAGMLGVGNLRVLQPAAEEGVGFGVVGELAEAVDTVEFMRFIQRRLGASVVRYSDIASSAVRRVAVCTGAGASLIGDARRAGADFYLTADMKYNDFMMPDKALTVADIGHFESEYCAIQLLFDILSKNLRTFAVRKSECSRNPVNYLV